MSLHAGDTELTIAAADTPPRRIRSLGIALGVYSATAGLISFLGWALDMPRLTDWDANGISIQPNTTVCVMLAGLATILLLTGRRGASAALGSVISLIAVATALEWLAGISLGIDTLLMFGREWGRVGVVYPGRMGPPGTLSWVLIGTALMLSVTGPAGRRFVSLLGLVVALLSSVSLLGYLFDASLLFTLPRLTVIAMQTATCILAVGVGLVLSEPGRQPMALLLSPTTAGTLARRIFPPTILVPSLVGWLFLEGFNAELYDAAFGSAMRTGINTVLFTLLAWWMLRQVLRRELSLAQAREELAAALAAVSDHKEQLAVTLASIGDAIVATDAEGRVTFMNATAERLTGWPHADALGRPLAEVFRIINDGTRREVESPVVKALREGAVVGLANHTVLVARDGTEWPIDDSAAPIRRGGGVGPIIGIVMVFRDITERRRTEAQLAADLRSMERLAELAARLVRAGDLDALLRDILAAAVDLTGTDKGNIQIFDPERETLRMTVHQGLGPRLVAHFAEDGWGATCSEAATRTARVIVEDVERLEQLRGTPGLEIVLEDGIRAIQSTPLVSRDGRLLGMLNTHFRVPGTPSDQKLGTVDVLARMAADVIERQQTELALRESEQNLDAANRAKDLFLATLSHELRTPLHTVAMWMSILRQNGCTAEDVKEGLEVIERSTRAQTMLIDDVLDVARITSGKFRLDLRHCDLREPVTAGVEVVRPASAAKNIELQLDSPDEVVAVDCDAGRVQQIVWNLVSNAVKFTPRGGEVTVRVRCEDSHAEISVSDNGAGIDPEFLPLVFDRFRQADSSTRRKFAGLGLGLSIVKHLAEMHGGGVSAQSGGLGKGSTFTVTMPILAVLAKGQAEENPSEVTRRGPGNEHGQAAAVRLHGVRVLLVDDEPDARRVLGKVMHDAGATVTLASSAAEALCAIAAKRVSEVHHVLVSDLGMPDQDGYELIREVRARGLSARDLPAVVVTAYAGSRYATSSVAAGYQIHLTKPVEPAVLIEAVKELASQVANRRASTNASGGEAGAAERTSE
jgi:PAS domain S-box-containing protein